MSMKIKTFKVDNQSDDAERIRDEIRIRNVPRYNDNEHYEEFSNSVKIGFGEDHK
jgi:hypothetical protein